jgi:hypothetical protein
MGGALMVVDGRDTRLSSERQRTLVLTFDTSEAAVEWDGLDDEQALRWLIDPLFLDVTRVPGRVPADCASCGDVIDREYAVTAVEDDGTKLTYCEDCWQP